MVKIGLLLVLGYGLRLRFLVRFRALRKYMKRKYERSTFALH